MGTVVGVEKRFGATEPYTVGVEEEFQLVDPSTLELAPAIEDVIGAYPDGTERLASELFQDCVELRTPVFSTIAELARQLPVLRDEVAQAAKVAGVRIAASGLHPISDPFAQRITPGDRYKRMEKELGTLAQLQIIYALHVHVAVPGGEAAIRATNALLRHVPLFVALSANSPFWNGMDTGFASARVKIRDVSPRSGLPPTFHSWDEFESYADALVAMGNIPDYSWFWWDVRPHPRHGTVELRVPDTQAEPDYVIALAALTQCLVATAEEYAPEDARYTSENKWRTIRQGLEARLYNFSTREEKGARETARNLINQLRPVSQDLGCEAELEGVSEILHRGTGADLQRAAYEKRGSLEDVVDYLLKTTAPV
ncbi:MAG: YbdK family carboxylate-amine ligase [Actinomycetota bacterium]|nr:YbdK family carboxylate-amine ligase [Actinomycetota bacterium]